MVCIWTMWWIRCIRGIFLGEIRDVRPSGVGGSPAFFALKTKKKRTDIRF